MVIDERENCMPETEETAITVVKNEEHKEKVEFTLDDDISQLVPPTFSTVSKGPPQPMLELSWEHKYTPMGDKLPTPNIHMCVDCKLPIRIYGRLVIFFLNIKVNLKREFYFFPFSEPNFPEFVDTLQTCLLSRVCYQAELLFLLF